MALLVSDDLVQSFWQFFLNILDKFLFNCMNNRALEHTLESVSDFADEVSLDLDVNMFAWNVYLDI